MSQYDVSPTDRQIKAVDAILEGQSSVGQAMRDAGYSDKTSLNPKQNFVDSRGVQSYLETLDEKSRKRFGQNVVGKAMDILLDALEAEKFVPVRATDSGYQLTYKVAKVPDHHMRIQAVDRVIKLTELERSRTNLPEQAPSFDSTEVIDFKQKFKEFLEQVT